jgi:predicted phosphohydrolase
VRDGRPVKITEKGDILILAGDIGDPFSKTYTLQLEQALGKFKTVIVIAGNHEYWNSAQPRFKRSIDNTIEQIRKVCSELTTNETKFVFLEKEFIEIDNVTFLGCTLWTNVNEDDAQYMNDMKQIDNWSIDQCRSEHKKAVEWLSNAIETNSSKTKVVITHHLPTFDLLYKSDRPTVIKQLKTAYASDLSHLVKSTDYWFCGHQHVFRDIKIDKCRCIINPIGTRAEVTNHKRNFYLTIE